MIHWCSSRLPVLNFFRVSIWHRKDIILMSKISNHALIPGRSLLMSRGMGRLWVDSVDNILTLD